MRNWDLVFFTQYGGEEGFPYLPGEQDTANKDVTNAFGIWEYYYMAAVLFASERVTPNDRGVECPIQAWANNRGRPVPMTPERLGTWLQYEIGSNPLERFFPGSSRTTRTGWDISVEQVGRSPPLGVGTARSARDAYQSYTEEPSLRRDMEQIQELLSKTQYKPSSLPPDIERELRRIEAAMPKGLLRDLKF